MQNCLAPMSMSMGMSMSAKNCHAHWHVRMHEAGCYYHVLVLVHMHDVHRFVSSFVGDFWTQVCRGFHFLSTRVPSLQRTPTFCPLLNFSFSLLFGPTTGTGPALRGKWRFPWFHPIANRIVCTSFPPWSLNGGADPEGVADGNNGSPGLCGLNLSFSRQWTRLDSLPPCGFLPFSFLPTAIYDTELNLTVVIPEE